MWQPPSTLLEIGALDPLLQNTAYLWLRHADLDRSYTRGRQPRSITELASSEIASISTGQSNNDLRPTVVARCRQSPASNRRWYLA